MAAISLVLGSFFGLIAAGLGWTVMGLDLLACAALYSGFAFGTLTLLLLGSYGRGHVTNE